MGDLFSESGKISSRRVVGLLSFLAFLTTWAVKLFFRIDVPNELLYATGGMCTTALFSTALRK